MIVVHPSVPGVRPEDQARCRAGLALLDRHIVHLGINEGDLYGYSLGLTNLWADEHDWLIVEHDVEVSPALVDELDACPRLLCVAPYVNPAPAAFLDHLCDEGVAESVATILGCTKITAAARRRCDPPGGVPWRILDGVLTSALARANGTTWHLHCSPALRPLHWH